MKRRLLISNVILVTIVLLLLEVPLALVYGRHEHDALDSALQRDASSLAALSEEIIEHPGDHDVGALAQRFTTGVGDQVAIVDRSGVRLTPNGPANIESAFQTALQDARAGALDRRGTRSSVSSSFRSAPTATPTAPCSSPVRTRRSTTASTCSGSPSSASALGVLIMSVLVSRRLARWTVDPLQRLDDHAAELGRGELHARADTHTGPPEVVALATTFNEMADRLDELVSSQRRFVADASHQLRTPLTALRLRLETLDPHDPVAVSTTRDAALQESARLTRVVDGLLALAPRAIDRSVNRSTSLPSSPNATRPGHRSPPNTTSISASKPTASS